MLRKTFVSRKYRFKFKYPLFWKKVANPDVFLLIVNTFGPETFNIIIGPIGPDYRRPEIYAYQWIEENRMAGTALELISEKPLSVNGTSGYEFNHTSPSEIDHKKVSFAKNGLEFVIDYGTTRNRFLKYEPVFNRITQSFRWL